MHDTITDENPTAVQAKIEAIEQALAQRIGTQKYRIWFKESTRLSLIGDDLKIGVPNVFTARWIENHFVAALRSAVESVTGHRPEISFSVMENTNTPGQFARPRIKTPAHGGTGSGHRPGSRAQKGSPQRLRLTLDSYVVGPSNELAFNAAQIVVREENSPFNPLFLHGGYGVGKTHLLQGICNAVSQKRPQTQWLYLSAEDFANQFILALKTKQLEAFRRRMRRTDLLAIDDIHFLANKPSTQEEFLHTFNTINLAGKQVVLVSDAAPKMIGQLSEKLVNRFVSGMVVKIDTPDFVTRCKICEQRAQAMIPSAFKGQLGKADARPKVPEPVIQYIAQNVRSNVRELEGALLKVIAYAALQNGPVTLGMAKSVLADHVERCDPIVHLSDIESAAATYFGITPTVLHSAKKDKTVSLARRFTMYLARKHTKMSSSEIGRFFDKNHTTVIAGSNKVEDLIHRDAELHWRGPAGNRVSRAKTTLMEIESNISNQ